MDEKGNFTREQVLLKKIRDEFCGGVSAKLAEDIGKDATYVNRLFYPIGKKGRKGIGLEVMRAVSEKFSLPPGFWEGADTTGAPAKKGDVFEAPTPEEMELIDNFRHMHDHDREEVAADIAKRAGQAIADRESWMKRFGLTARPASASARKAAATAKTTADDSKQRPLPLPDSNTKSRTKV